MLSAWMVGSPTANRPRQAATLPTVKGIQTATVVPSDLSPQQPTSVGLSAAPDPIPPNGKTNSDRATPTPCVPRAGKRSLRLDLPESVAWSNRDGIHVYLDSQGVPSRRDPGRCSLSRCLQDRPRLVSSSDGTNASPTAGFVSCIASSDLASPLFRSTSVRSGGRRETSFDWR